MVPFPAQRPCPNRTGSGNQIDREAARNSLSIAVFNRQIWAFAPVSEGGKHSIRCPAAAGAAGQLGCRGQNALSRAVAPELVCPPASGLEWRTAIFRPACLAALGAAFSTGPGRFRSLVVGTAHLSKTLAWAGVTMAAHATAGMTFAPAREPQVGGGASAACWPRQRNTGASRCVVAARLKSDASHLPSVTNEPSREHAMVISIDTPPNWRDIARVASGEMLALAPAAWERVAHANRIVTRIVENGVRAYGVNTGVARFRTR